MGDADSHPDQGSRQHIERDMLPGRDRRIQDPQAPQPIKDMGAHSGTHLAQETMQPKCREHGKSHMQRGTRVARGIDGLEENEGWMFRPIYSGYRNGGWPK